MEGGGRVPLNGFDLGWTMHTELGAWLHQTTSWLQRSSLQRERGGYSSESLTVIVTHWSTPSLSGLLLLNG